MAGADHRSQPAAVLAKLLAGQAEPVCRHYLSNGYRSGNYWLVGDVHNAAGRSLYVRLKGSDHGPGAAGKWTDAATGEHGDLLDIIAHVRGLTKFRDIADEARRFLSLQRSPQLGERHRGPTRASSPEAARRLHAMSVPIMGTLAEVYLRHRGITDLAGCDALRFHPHCYYRDRVTGLRLQYPALVAAVTDNTGAVTGVQRTWLRADGLDKAPLDPPRRAMGQLLGCGVRLGWPANQPISVMAAGEGIETMLSLRMVLPTMPMVACLSAGHLGAFIPPPGLRRLYIAADTDKAGFAGAERLARRARGVGIEVIVVQPFLGDFNDDLCRQGFTSFLAGVARQLLPEERHLNSAAR